MEGGLAVGKIGELFRVYDRINRRWAELPLTASGEDLAQGGRDE